MIYYLFCLTAARETAAPGVVINLLSGRAGRGSYDPDPISDPNPRRKGAAGQDLAAPAISLSIIDRF